MQELCVVTEVYPSSSVAHTLLTMRLYWHLLHVGIHIMGLLAPLFEACKKGAAGQVVTGIGQTAGKPAFQAIPG